MEKRDRKVDSEAEEALMVKVVIMDPLHLKHLISQQLSNNQRNRNDMKPGTVKMAKMEVED